VSGFDEVCSPAARYVSDKVTGQFVQQKGRARKQQNKCRDSAEYAEVQVMVEARINADVSADEGHRYCCGLKNRKRQQPSPNLLDPGNQSFKFFLRSFSHA
jgi:hypothetical protein